jgi:hypothetical protein
MMFAQRTDMDLALWIFGAAIVVFDLVIMWTLFSG